MEIIKNDNVTEKSTVVNNPKFKVGSTVYYFTSSGIVKTKVINVWKHTGCYSYDVKGYDGCNRLEYELFHTLGALIKDLKESLTDYSKD